MYLAGTFAIGVGADLRRVAGNRCADSWLPGTAALRGALVIGIGAHAILTMRHWATRSASRAILGVELDSDRTVRLTERTGRRIDGMVQPDSYVGSLLTTLVVRPDGKRRLRTVAILPDMLPADDFRRLRLLLRLGHGSTTAADS
jgi:hypothetical protein